MKSEIFCNFNPNKIEEYMKKILFLLILTIVIFNIKPMVAQENNMNNLNPNTALLIIDIQYFYFPDGAVPLVNPEKAALNAQHLLIYFRENKLPVIHVKHIAKSGAEIHELVAPLEAEKVIAKQKANAFVGTDLLDHLKSKNIENLIICGMQTHMCVEAATRAASDYGFNCTVVEDACTTRDLKFENITIKAEDVHFSTLSALNGTYAKILKTNDIVNK